MAIIVDKVQKRQDIALSCKELVLEHGIKNLTISQLAKEAGVGKGTIYDYFKNKEDLVFEIVNFMLINFNEDTEKRILAAKSTQEKIKEFSSFFYKEDKAELREFYKEFRAIALTTPNEDMIEFNAQCDARYRNWHDEIIQEGIDKGEIIPEAKNLVHGLFASAEGLFINACARNKLDSLEQEMNAFIEAIFSIIEVKKNV